MAKKKEFRTKQIFCTCYSDHISSEPGDGIPKAMGIHISFEEALKLHFSLGQALAKLNSLNRATTEGKRSCVKVTLYPRDNYIAGATIEIAKEDLIHAQLPRTTGA